MMEERMVPPSIFNAVLGPIMRGPSSSHTAASVRIGKLGRKLAGGRLRKATFFFDPNGSLATTYRGQGSAMGLAGGLLGFDVSDPRLLNAEEICLREGIDLFFRIESYGAVHPNTYRVELVNEQDNLTTFTALSTGGGQIKLIELDGKSVTDDRKYVGPLMVVQEDEEAVMPFSTLVDLLRYSDGKGKLSDFGVLYESTLCGLEKERVVSIMRDIYAVMQQSVTTGLEGTLYEDRILHQQSHFLSEKSLLNRLVQAPVTNAIIQNVTAVMETKSAMGVIVAAPTAGSCGTLPGVLAAVADRTGKSDEEIVDALFAAGMVGVFIAAEGGFAAEEGGCQYECGAASSMAAAALVTLMGGDVSASFSAASMALQNMLGLICDPVADRVEVPCLGKNIMAAQNSLAAANMALAGFNHTIPLQEVITALKEVGDGMSSRYRCTGKGGLSITPSALILHGSLVGDQ